MTTVLVSLRDLGVIIPWCIHKHQLSGEADRTHCDFRPTLSTCGQCAHDFSKKGLVTPMRSPALGGALFTNKE